MPLAEGKRGVARIAQDFGHGGGFVRDMAPHVRKTTVEVRHMTHSDGVMIAPGQQRCSGRRAERGHMKVREANTFGRHAIDVRGRQRRAEASQMGKSHVVEKYDDDVGRILAGMRAGRPPRCRLRNGATDVSLELLHVPLLDP